eukprot:2382712-Prymnesium_polylepis.1
MCAANEACAAWVMSARGGAGARSGRLAGGISMLHCVLACRSGRSGQAAAERPISMHGTRPGHVRTRSPPAPHAP